MAKTVAEQFVEILAAAGVKRIYGIVGDSLTGLTDAIRRHGKIEWIHVRHEEVAAGAEAHLTGQLAVCAGSCGPGNLHLINGLFDCQRSRVPVLAIAAQIPSPEIGSGYFQKSLGIRARLAADRRGNGSRPSPAKSPSSRTADPHARIFGLSLVALGAVCLVLNAASPSARICPQPDRDFGTTSTDVRSKECATIHGGEEPGYR